MTEQLTMFEPSGAELATLAAQAFSLSDALCRRAELMTMRGMLAAANTFKHDAQQNLERAFIFETALQFETEAGIQ